MRTMRKGAATIRDAFRDQKFAVPEFWMDKHYENESERPKQEDASVVIRMGLGFSDQTKALIGNACAEWMNVAHETKVDGNNVTRQKGVSDDFKGVGDAFALHPDLYPLGSLDLF